MEQRIRMIMDHEHLTQQEFAQKLEISSSSLSNIFNGRTKATNNHVQAIHRAFPSIDINWLLFGEGEMCGLSSGTNLENELGITNGFNAQSSSSETSMHDISNEAKMTERTLYDSVDSSPLFAKPSGAPSKSLGSEQLRSQPNLDSIQSLSLFDKGVKIIDNRPRKIKEIRVFYDDGTYESFSPS